MIDKYHKITEIEGVLFDKDGEEIRELQEEQIGDVSGISNGSLYDDYRVKFAELYHDQYPYTVEYKVTMKINGGLQYPDWYSRNTINPVEISRFEVNCPEDLKIRYWCNRDSVAPIITKDGSDIKMVWEEKNQTELSKDAFNDDLEDIAIHVSIAPSKFEFEGIEGDMRTWAGFGEFFKPFYFDKEDVLSEESLREVAKVYLPDDDKLTKARKLYEYMQDRTRYISVQLGIGSWKPFPAEYVHKRGYGDCKALTNYLKVILQSAGISSFPVIIHMAGKGFRLKENFPSNQFNHVILGLPLANDTMYIECTSSTQPFAKIHEGIENRSALWLSPDGCRIVVLPPSSASANMQLQKSNVNLSTGGTSVQLNYCLTGNVIQKILNLLEENTPEERQEWIKRFTTIPDVKIDSYTIDTSNISKQVSFSINASSNMIISKTGSRLFLQPNLTEKRGSIPPDIPVRYSPVRFLYPYTEVDTVQYTLPAGYAIETIPAAVSLQTDFGFYEASVSKISETEILFRRKYEIREYEIPAKNYPEYRKFFAAIVKSDKASVVLVKKP
ncbi:MAG: DUF3857 domain-containing protein [Ignavibacteriales bacterium]|nr:DUF3857 domain-containing protein [Ignavibacteriales bacterium]